MKILITTVQTPFVRGGAELHAEALLTALKAANHQAEIVAIPFKQNPPEQLVNGMLISRLLDLSVIGGQTMDRIIALKFPAYLIPHPHKVPWVLHQYREAYELWGSDYCGLCHYPNGSQVRETIINADNKAFAESQAIFANSANVAKRLKKFNNVDATPLYHPPHNASQFYCEAEQGYFFFPSRLTQIKRQELVIRALPHTTNPVKVIFAGKADVESYAEYLKTLVDNLGVSERAIFLGSITEAEKFRYYAQALAVIYPPFEEDYGYVTLEGMLSSKPVITCLDSGGSLEFAHHQETGWIAEPNPVSVAQALDYFWENRSWATQLGKAAYDYYQGLNITWPNVIKELLK